MSNRLAIVSLKHTEPKDDFITFWRPQDRGYTVIKQRAGQYDAKLIREKARFYNNGHDTLAIDFGKLDQGWIPVPDGYSDFEGDVLPNAVENWAALLLLSSHRPSAVALRGLPVRMIMLDEAWSLQYG